ncbi:MULTISPECIES: hypothetical protein [unclassified Methylobacterium]|uniref:hypothetical protein n=1 Tax=unclassified Methylobacterium TaxID=2615210 RepID=UPI001FBAA341|nr:MULTISPECIES: hypothetical protein [unclassified Methylobacterium]MCJ2021597.1 hypothetical protein [Methylobacterium sp. E-065]
MPLTRYLDGGAHILPADGTLIRFAMTDGARVIGIDVPIPVLRQQFGAGADGAPLDLFARNQAAIEAAASRAYDRTDTPNDLLDMGPEDFDTGPAQAKL